MQNTLRSLRERHDMTQAELADAVGVTRQTIISIERGRYDPKLELAFAFAAYFECSVHDIFQPDTSDLPTVAHSTETDDSAPGSIDIDGFVDTNRDDLETLAGKDSPISALVEALLDRYDRRETT